MHDWLTGALREPAVLVTVAQAEGSVPREAGAHMLVSSSALVDDETAVIRPWSNASTSQSLLRFLVAP